MDVTGLNFGRALSLLKLGKSVSRETWADGRFIKLSDDHKAFESIPAAPIDFLPTMIDLLAEDWFLISDAETEEHRLPEEGKNVVAFIVHVPEHERYDTIKEMLSRYNFVDAHHDYEQARVNLLYHVHPVVADTLTVSMGNKGYHTTIRDV